MDIDYLFDMIVRAEGEIAFLQRRVSALEEVLRVTAQQSRAEGAPSPSPSIPPSTGFPSGRRV